MVELSYITDLMICSPIFAASYSVNISISVLVHMVASVYRCSFSNNNNASDYPCIHK